MVNSGCGQCHDAEMGTPRRVLGRTAADITFDTFAAIVYRHTDAYPNGRMGNYSPERLAPSTLRQIFDFTRALGFRASIRAVVERGASSGAQQTYTVTLENTGTAKSGVAAEGIALVLTIPTSVKVVNATGGEYAGVSQGSDGLAAAWSVARLDAGEKRTYTITVSGNSQELFKGSMVKWKAPGTTRPPNMTLRQAGVPDEGDEVAVTLPPSESR
jgi:hypothetical protein